MKHLQCLFVKQITKRQITLTLARGRKGNENWPTFQPSHINLVFFYYIKQRHIIDLSTGDQYTALVNGFYCLWAIFGPRQLALAQTMLGTDWDVPPSRLGWRYWLWRWRECNCIDVVRPCQLASGARKRPSCCVTYQHRYTHRGSKLITLQV